MFVFMLFCSLFHITFSFDASNFFKKTHIGSFHSKSIESSILLRMSSNALFDSLKPKLNEYLITKEKMNLGPLADKEINEIEIALEAVKPSGFYVDEEKKDFERRSDNRIPKKLHPLSYIELRRHGYEDLVYPVMELGGPHSVGNLLGVAWSEPKNEKWDEALRPVRKESYAFDMTGDLKLGGALEEDLATMGDLIDMKQLKKDMENKKNKNKNIKYNKGVLDGEDYIETRKNIKRPSPKAAAGERFRLNSLEKLYFIATLTSNSLVHGRATQDLISITTIDSSSNSGISNLLEYINIVSSSLILASLLSSIVSYTQARIKNRNNFMWCFKGLIGGPITLSQIAKLESLDINDDGINE